MSFACDSDKTCSSCRYEEKDSVSDFPCNVANIEYGLCDRWEPKQEEEDLEVNF